MTDIHRTKPDDPTLIQSVTVEPGKRAQLQYQPQRPLRIDRLEVVGTPPVHVEVFLVRFFVGFEEQLAVEGPLLVFHNRPIMTKPAHPGALVVLEVENRSPQKQTVSIRLHGAEIR